MLIQQLLQINESKSFNMHDEVKVISGEHRGKEGYINKIETSKDGKVSFEIEIESDGEYVDVEASEIKKIDSVNESAAEGGFVIELRKDGKCKGYYVADDRGPSKSINKALKYPTMAAAAKDAKLSNQQWDLPYGEKFVAVALQKPVDEALIGKNYTHPDWEVRARPGKKFFIQYKNGDNHSGPYATEDEAEIALDKILHKKHTEHDDEERAAIKGLKIVRESVQLDEAAKVSAKDKKLADKWFADNFEDHGLPLTCKLIGGIAYITTAVSNDNWNTEKDVAIKIENGEITKFPASKFNKLASKINEEYEVSSDFDADMDTAMNHVSEAMKIVKSTSWKKHMKDTDSFYGTEGEEKTRSIEEHLDNAHKALSALYHHFIEDAQ